MTDPRGEAEQRYSYEFIKGRDGDGGHYRIRNWHDNAVGFCYSEFNARLLVDALNTSQSTLTPPSHARAVAEKCLDILCASLHEAEAEGHDLPACVSLAWSEVTMIQTTTLPDAPQPASVEIPQGLSEIGRRNWLIGYWKERAEKAEMPLELPLSETPPSGTAKPTGSWRPFKAMEKSAHWTVIDENHNTLFTCWRGEIDARRICELHTLHTSAASPDGNEEKGK